MHEEWTWHLSCDGVLFFQGTFEYIQVEKVVGHLSH